MGSVSETSPLQYWKAARSILVKPSGSVTEISPSHPQNAASRIMVNLLGRLRDLMPLQYWKAARPIEVKVAGNVTEVRPLQLPKASLPMLVNWLGSMREISPAHSKKLRGPILVNDCGSTRDGSSVQLEGTSANFRQRVREHKGGEIAAAVEYTGGPVLDFPDTSRYYKGGQRGSFHADANNDTIFYLQYLCMRRILSACAGTHTRSPKRDLV